MKPVEIIPDKTNPRTMTIHYMAIIDKTPSEILKIAKSNPNTIIIPFSTCPPAEIHNLPDFTAISTTEEFCIHPPIYIGNYCDPHKVIASILTQLFIDLPEIGVKYEG